MQGELQSRLLYPARLSFKIEREIKSFQDKNKLKELITPNQYSKKCCRVFFKNKKNKQKTEEQLLAKMEA